MAIKFLLDKALQEQQETIAKILDVVRKKPYPTIETGILGSFTHSLFKVGPKFRPIVEHWRAELEEVKAREEEERKAEKALESASSIGEQKRLLGRKEREFEEREKEMRLDERRVEREVARHPPEVFAVVEDKPRVVPLPQAPLPPDEAVPEVKGAEHAGLEVSAFDEHLVGKPSFERREYVVSAFGRPVGVVVEEDPATEKPKYTVVEPVLDESLALSVRGSLKGDFQKDRSALDNDSLISGYLKASAKKFGIDYSDDMIRAAKYYAKRDLAGFGKIEVLMDDDRVRGIYCDGVHKPILVKLRDVPGKVETNVVFTDNYNLDLLLTKLAKVAGKALSESSPIMDVTFHGFRIQGTKGVGGVSSKLIIEKVGE